MAKVFRRIRQKLLTENKFSKYLLYAIGEIALVVIGIIIALQINTWNNGKIERQEEKKSYLNIKRQLIDDKNELIKVKGDNKNYAAIYEYGNKIIMAQDRTKTDSLTHVAIGLSQYSDFHSSGNIYETLVNSGELKLLKNSEITSAIQHLEKTYIFTNNLENIHWELIINELSPELKGVINYATMKAVKPEKLYAVELQNIFIEIIGLCKYKDATYGQALGEIDTINKLIDEELNSHEYEQLSE
ncbi:DUF6090 family protein [Maribacter halichondriae]|uniref:DUF6090 family protein n=1 Tax=Maribacter halichondriae TaxID=2980554 RepID=UPI002359F604|nr:DUF6090 family protein [Maribacter sp. Hal144]